MATILSTYGAIIFAHLSTESFQKTLEVLKLKLEEATPKTPFQKQANPTTGANGGNRYIAEWTPHGTMTKPCLPQQICLLDQQPMDGLYKQIGNQAIGTNGIIKRLTQASY